MFDGETQKVIADIEGRAAQLMKDLGSAAGTQNIDRILRLPGTTNLPTKKKLREGRVQCRAKLIEFGTSTFAPDDFPKAPAHQHGESQSKPKDDKKAKASPPPGTKKELSPRLIGMLMVPNGGAGVKHYYDGYTYESRSGLLYGFLRGCISESIDSYVMYAACVDDKYSGKAIYEHVAEQAAIHTAPISIARSSAPKPSSTPKIRTQMHQRRVFYRAPRSMISIRCCRSTNTSTSIPASFGCSALSTAFSAAS